MKDTSISTYQRDAIRDFLLILALCNSTIPEEVDGKIKYQSQSPDEVTLTETAALNGFALKKRSADDMVITVGETDVTYKLLGIMEFTSSRRRMSVIIQTPENKYFILSKGADVIIYERLKKKFGYRRTFTHHFRPT